MTTPIAPRPKATWPLMALAVLAFVPGLGFFIGAAALTWGLLSSRPRAKLAAAIAGAGALLNLAGVMVAMFSMRDNPLMKEARQRATRDDLGQLVLALERFRDKRGRYPLGLQELMQPVPIGLVNIYDQSSGTFIPRLYHYRRLADSTGYDVFAVGSDGTAGTPDDIRPQIPDSLLGRVGYRPSSE